MCSEIDASAPPDAYTLPEVDAYVENDAATSLDVGTDTFVPDAGPVHGHAVVIGHQGTTADDSVDAMITNSVFLSERPATGDLRVAEYTQFAIDGASTRVNALIDAAALARGRGVVYSAIEGPSTFTASLARADVLLVLAQYTGGGGTLSALGASAHDDVLAFLDSGGVVVILLNSRTESGAHHEEWRLASGEGLFNAPSDPWGAYAATCEIASPSDPVAAGVLTPYAPVHGANCLNGMSGGTVVARTSTTDTPPLCPVVRHLVR